jgi:hypothetical protein
LTKIKKAAPVLTFTIDNNNQSINAFSNGIQVGSLANSTLSVREQYNGVNTTLQLISAPTINSSSAFVPITKTVSNLTYPTMPSATDTVELGVTGSVTDSEGVSRAVFGNVSLTKVKKAVPNVEIAVSPTAQTIVSNSKGSGSAVPQTLIISASEGNISRFTSLGTPVYTNGLSGTTSTNTLTFTANASSMSTDTGKVTIPVNYEDSEGNTGTKDVIATISKARTAAPTTVVRLSSDTQTVLSSSAGYDQPQPITVTVSEGTTDYIYSNTPDADMPNSTYKIIYSVPANYDFETNALTPDTPTTNNGITVLIWVKYKNSEGTVGQIDKTHNVVVTTGGATGQDGSNGVNITITPASQTITKNISGVYSAPIPIVVSVIEGGITPPYTYSSTLATNKTFDITSINQTNTTGNTSNSNGTITLGTPNSIAGSVVSFNVRYKDSKGTTVSNIPQSHSINVALDGSTGPGIVFTGVWDTLRAYQYDISNGRRDAVLYNDIYYATLQPTTAATDTPNVATAFWQSLGSEDFFVAAKIAIFEESFVKNTLNIGTNVNDGISSANITLSGGTIYPYFSLGQITAGAYNENGIFIGAVNDSGTKYKMSLKSATNSLLWDGSGLTINGSGTFTGTVTATAGAIGGWSISSTELAGGSPSGGGDGSFTSSGIRLGSSGYISSKNFYINSSGAAVFKGDITGASGTIGGVTLDNSGISAGDVKLTSAGLVTTAGGFGSSIQNYSMFTSRLRLYQNLQNQGGHGDSLTFDYLEPVSTGTVSMQVTSGGLVKKASSSRRYKKNIEDTTLNEAKRILNLNVRSFNGLSQSDDEDKVIGLVAEEVLDLGYNDLVVMGESGSVESVYYQSVFSSMVKVVQDLNSRIEQLEAKLSGSI